MKTLAIYLFPPFLAIVKLWLQIMKTLWRCKFSKFYAFYQNCTRLNLAICLCCNKKLFFVFFGGLRGRKRFAKNMTPASKKGKSVEMFSRYNFESDMNPGKKFFLTKPLIRAK